MSQTAATTPRRAPRPPLKEVGKTGLQMSNGLVVEEFNAKLQAPDCYAVFDKMLRSDGQVYAVEAAVTLPLESLNWWIEPGGPDPIDIEIAEGLDANLMRGMTCTWEDTIAEAVMSLPLGCSVLEKVWEPDGRLRKIAPRHPRTIKEWTLDEHGGVQGIVQQITEEDGRQRDEPIEIEKLLRFTWPRSSNPEGIAMLRPMYKHWWIKDTLYRIQAMGLERFWMPILYAMLAPNANDDDKIAAKGTLEAIRAAEGGGLVFPYGYGEPKALEVNPRVPDIQTAIVHHDLMIARTGLAPFLNLGSSDVGSWALSDSQVRFFIMSLTKAAKMMKAVFTRYLGPQWVGYRYPGYDRFPTFQCSNVAHVVQPGAVAEVLKILQSAGVLDPDDAIADMIREVYDLPPRRVEEGEDEGEETIPNEDVGASRRHRSLTAASRKRQRPRDDAAFARNDRRLTAAKDKFQKDMTEIVQRQHKQLKAKLEPLIEEFREAADLSKGSVLKKMQQLEVPLVGKYENLISQWLRDFYSTAVERAAKEAKVEPPKSISNAVRTWLSTRAQAIAQKHAEALRAAVLFEALDVVRTEIPTKQVLWNAEQQARQRANLDIREDLIAAGRELTDLVNDALSEVEVGVPE